MANKYNTLRLLSVIYLRPVKLRFQKRSLFKRCAAFVFGESFAQIDKIQWDLFTRQTIYADKNKMI